MTDLDALTRSWCLYVSGRIGIVPPTTDHAHWLRLHWSEAAACMVPAVTCVMEAEVGEIRHE